MVRIGVDMHNLSWRITALVEVDVVLAVNPAKPKYDSFIQLISRFNGNYIRIVYEAEPGGFDL